MIYNGKVVKTADFGAFVNFLGSKDGLVHISELQQGRVGKTTDVVNVGDAVKVKVIGFDERGKVKLSMRVVDQATGADITEQVGAKPASRRSRPRGSWRPAASGGERHEHVAPVEGSEQPQSANSAHSHSPTPAEGQEHLHPGGRRRNGCVKRPGGTEAMKAINAIRMGGSRRPAAGRGRQGRLHLQRHLVRQLGVRRRRRHVQRRQCRQLRRGRAADPAGLSRPHAARAARGAGRLRASQGGIDPGARAPMSIAGGKGRIHANILWEMGGAERIITEVLEQAQGPDQRHHLRRRHALSAVRHRRAVQRPLLPDRLLGARLQRAVEARLLARRRRCWAAWSTRTRGSPAAITACPTARTRPSRRTRIPRVLALRKLMREFGLDETPIIMAGGVWWLEEWEDWIDNPGPRADRLPVRHPPAADQGKPDRRRLEAAAADAEGGRRLPQPLQPDRLLLQRGEQRLHPGTAGTQRAAGRLHHRADRRARRRISASARASASSI